MFIKINFTEAEIKDLIVFAMRKNGWEITEFKCLEANGVMGTENPKNKLIIYAECQATEL